VHKPAMPTGRSDSTREEHEPTSALLWDEAVGARSLPRPRNIAIRSIQETIVNSVLDAACAKFGVSVVRALVPGGQKQVIVVAGSDGVERVLKLIDLGIATDPSALERARREVALLRDIDHPNVVRLTSDLMEISDPSVAVAWLEELLDGQDLRHCGSKWPADQLVALGRDVAAGLGELHRRHVIHRDLSPGNIQRCHNGRFVVMDPGFARHTLRSGVTVGGQPGTPGFMTPEHLQAYSGAPTPASDVFGCAALVYFAATGQPPVPYKGDDVDYLRRLRTAAHVPLHDARPDLPASLASVVERALHPQPARRYRNGAALAAAFGAA
jgi:eukaryotic-like serine/threonine-protein kinase